MLQPPARAVIIRGLLTVRDNMDELDFEHALNSVADSATDDRYWVALFCEDGKFVSTVYSEVVRACALQWGGRYADKWQELSLFLREMFVAMGGPEEDCNTAEDGLRLIHNAMRSPVLFKDALGRCSVLPTFAGLMYDAIRKGRDGIQVMRFLDCVDHDTAGCVLQYWQGNLVENQFELAAVVTKASDVNPIMYPINRTWDAAAAWNDHLHVEEMVRKAVIQTDDFYVIRNGKLRPFSPTGLDPFSISQEETTPGLWTSWVESAGAWQAECQKALQSPMSNAKTYEGYCQSLSHRHKDLPHEELCTKMYEFLDSVRNIYNWCKNKGGMRTVERAGGFVLGTMNESDLMRSWLE